MNDTLGPLVKLKETLGVFVRNAPSPRELLANRTQRFDRIHAILPSTARPGESVGLTVQAWDQCERLHRAFEGTATVASTAPSVTHPQRVSFTDGDEGVVRVPEVTFDTPGVHHLCLTETVTGERFVSSPIRVADEHDSRVYWGDIHLHSIFSDGAGHVEDGYRFARDVMELDVAAPTDRDGSRGLPADREDLTPAAVPVGRSPETAEADGEERTRVRTDGGR